ncbi:uncharacterized protein [Bemisia tabaci]|uniref:uncharacterized protein isoform X2 n=1 Tax=Bemisia tabaci TaxID=7038 RepID=UPI003B282355
MQLVRGFSWSYYPRLSHECPPIKTRERPVSAGKHHVLLLGAPGPTTLRAILEPATKREPDVYTVRAILEPATTPEPDVYTFDIPEYEYVEHPALSQQKIEYVEEYEYLEDKDLRKELIKPQEPDEPSPFALFLVDKQFEKFEEKMNDEFQFAEDHMPKETPPVWHIYNYKAYMMQAFCKIRIKYEVRGGMKTGDDYCDHLIVPKQGNSGSAFIVNYVVSESEKDLRKDAKKCLKTMFDQRFGLELENRHPPLDDVYKIAISFCGPKAVVEYSNATIAMKLESTTRRKTENQMFETGTTKDHFTMYTILYP